MDDEVNIAFTQVDADSVDILNKHFPVTRGNVRTRFIAQRNGNLHIAHVMAMFVNFGLAKKLGGDCYLRLDDTKPAAAESNYIDQLEENMGWMGCDPFKITRVSDYFKQLYDSAVELIRLGHAYVDHQGYDEIEENMEKKMDSPGRDRSIDDSLKSFDRMKNGLYKEGETTLRIKTEDAES